jgi:hypothetical protein
MNSSKLASPIVSGKNVFVPIQQPLIPFCCRTLFTQLTEKIHVPNAGYYPEDKEDEMKVWYSLLYKHNVFFRR